jgi:ribosomal protein S18 acetylase RimI-like enzyme
MRYRPGTTADTDAIAALHAASWRRVYRGAFTDEFLDGDLGGERRAHWSVRLADPDPALRTVVADDGGALAGFAHTVLGLDPKWGALLDNLHVAAGRQGSGIGTRLLGETAAAVLDHDPASRLHLWVLEQNVEAQAFYEARGGQRRERTSFPSPSGTEPPCFRYVWPDPSILLGALGS